MLINTVRFFHEKVTAQSRLNGELLEGIMASGRDIPLFNLYSCADTECCIMNVEDAYEH